METTIGARIRQLREAKQLSVAEFAKAAGIKPSAVYGLESDANKPSLETVATLRQSFPGLNTEWLQFGDGEMFSRALTPVAVPLARPDATASLTVSYPTPEEYRQLQDEIRRLREQLTETERQLAQKDGKLTAVEEERVWLRKQVGGKTEASAEAAGKDAQPPVMVAARNHEYVEVPAEEQERYSRVGFVWGR